ncbi:MAG: hypothetical protein J6U17_02235 [Kiritimatiellae bacterium]|nr:hypothetical protein [Kiritimatiellia bacterium]
MSIKKFIVASAIAFCASMAMADAQVYEVTMTLKTTVAYKGSTSTIVCSEPANGTGLYRKQTTVRIKGLIWGCDCITISEPMKAESAEGTYGYVFWNMTTGKVLDPEFAWTLLNRIDKRLTKVEGAWKMENSDLMLVGGGFGTLKDVVDKECCTIESTVLTTISGNCAGWMKMPSTIVSKGKDEVCEKCTVIAGTDDVIAVAPGFTLCECADDSDQTAISGTWRIKYSKALSTKWNKASAATPITSIYNFPSYVLNYLNSL